MTDIIINKDIKDKIFTIRGIQVMLDSDLAKIYGVDTKVFNQAVKETLIDFLKDLDFSSPPKSGNLYGHKL